MQDKDMLNTWTPGLRRLVPHLSHRFGTSMKTSGQHSITKYRIRLLSTFPTDRTLEQPSINLLTRNSWNNSHRVANGNHAPRQINFNTVYVKFNDILPKRDPLNEIPMNSNIIRKKENGIRDNGIYNNIIEKSNESTSITMQLDSVLRKRRKKMKKHKLKKRRKKQKALKIRLSQGR